MAPAPQTVDAADSAHAPADPDRLSYYSFIQFPRAVCYAGAAESERMTKGDCGGKEEERSGDTTRKRGRPHASQPTPGKEGIVASARKLLETLPPHRVTS